MSDALSRHYYFMKNYVYYYGKQKKENDESLSKFKTDFQLLKESYQFLPEDEEFILGEGEEEGPLSPQNNSDNNSSEVVDEYGKKLALSYYSKLHREYALADLSRFQTGNVGLCWRTEEQVITGKGQFICGEISCNSRENLKSFELNFQYVEKEIKKAALVKVQLCEVCAYKLHYKKLHSSSSLHASSSETLLASRTKEKRIIKKEKEKHKHKHKHRNIEDGQRKEKKKKK